MGRIIRAGLDVRMLESGSRIEAPGISALLLSKDPERLRSLVHPTLPTPDTVVEIRLQKGSVWTITNSN